MQTVQDHQTDGDEEIGGGVHALQSHSQDPLSILIQQHLEQPLFPNSIDIDFFF